MVDYIRTSDSTDIVRKQMGITDTNCSPKRGLVEVIEDTVDLVDTHGVETALQRAESTSLESLGRGGDRVVLHDPKDRLLGGECVIKINKWTDGVSNLIEVRNWCMVPEDLRHTLAKVYFFSSNHRWLIMEKASGDVEEQDITDLYRLYDNRGIELVDISEENVGRKKGMVKIIDYARGVFSDDYNTAMYL